MEDLVDLRVRPAVSARSPSFRRAAVLALLVLLTGAERACAQPAGAAIGPETEAREPAGRFRQMIVDEHFQQPAPTANLRGFTAYGGDWRVEEGTLWVGAGRGPKLLADEPPFAKGEVGVEVLLPDRKRGNAGLIVKVSQPGEGADRFNGYEISLDAAGQVLRLGRHRQNFEHIDDVPCPLPTQQWIALVVRLTKNFLEVRVDGKRLITYEDREHPLTTGTVGLRPWMRQARYRNLWVNTDGRTKPIPFEAADAAQRDVSRPWQAIQRGSVRAAFSLRPAESPGGQQSQEIAFLKGEGEVGIAHHGAGGAGIPLIAGRPYEGLLLARAEQPTEVCVAAESADASIVASARLAVTPGDWQRLRFTLVPDRAERAGQLAVKLPAPGRVVLGGVLLQPGDWAWPKGLRREGLPPIAVVTRHPLTRPPAIGCDLWAAQPSGPGCSIRIFHPARPDQRAETIFVDPQGSIYDMNVSHDARSLLFSYRRKEEKHWHIWRIGTDGTGLEQLTDGPYHDVGPCPLPDGGIVFVSTRRFGHTVCQPGPASNLHRMDADGSHVRCVSMNTLSDFSPQMLPDGRVLFTRWEYIDRDLTYRQSLWTQNPDGTSYQLYFGNTIRDVGTFWQARPLPGHVDRVAATFAPHHGFPHGAIGLIDRSRGPEGPRGEGFVWITREFSEIGDRPHEWAYRDPFPLSGRTLLCSYGGGGALRYRVFLLDVDDNKRLIYDDPAMGCYYPLPLRAMPAPRAIGARAPVDPTRADQGDPGDGEPLGTFLLADVYQGLEPAVRRGRVKQLRVMEQTRKTEDLASRAFDQSPVMSYGTYYAKRCWGTVPVLEDGSACFKAPALREIYFQVLDAEGRELQRMTSAVQVMPGERISCIGCHEPRQAAPPAGRPPLAARRPPSDLQKPPWASDGIIDFPTVVQPVLDNYCVECHCGGDPDGGCDLSGDKTRLFNMAYDNLLGRSRSYRQHDMAAGQMLPAEQAKPKPLVHFYWLLRTPTAVNRPLWTGSHASRLPDYLDTDHCGQEIPPEDRRRIYLWIDANVPYYGTYAHSRPLSPGKRDLCTDPETGQPAAWFARDFLGVYNRRCAACHGDYPHPNDHANIWDGRLAWINFTHPYSSPALTAHLAKDAGGRGIDKTADGEPVAMFSGTDDPDYQTMLRAIETGKKAADQKPEADMPGFQGSGDEP